MPREESTRSIVEWTTSHRVQISAAASVGFILAWLITIAFGKWFPGCHDFNTHLQQAGTAARAQAALAACPDVTVGDTRLALLVDTFFPICYSVWGAGMLLLMASSAAWKGKWHRVRAACVWLAAAVVAAGALDLVVENGSLLLVTISDWPPHNKPMTEYLLLTAALASWAKITLFLGAGIGWILALLRWVPFLVRWLFRPRTTGAGELVGTDAAQE